MKTIWFVPCTYVCEFKWRKGQLTTWESSLYFTLKPMCHLRWLWQPENTRVSVTYNQTYVLHWNPHCCKCPLLCTMHTYTDTCTWHQFIHTRFKTHNRGSLFIQWLIASFSALSKSWALIPDLLPCGLVNVFSFYCCSTLKEKKIAETDGCLHPCLHLWQLWVSCLSSVRAWSSQAARDRACHTGFTVFCLSPSSYLHSA